MDTSDKSEATGGEAATRRLRSLDEKLSIPAEVAGPGGSVASVARKHDVIANLLFAWRRLHRLGLLEGQRHAAATVAGPPTTATPMHYDASPSNRSTELLELHCPARSGLSKNAA